MIFALEKSISGCCKIIWSFRSVKKKTEWRGKRYGGEWRTHLSHELLQYILLLHLVACWKAHLFLSLVELQKGIKKLDIKQKWNEAVLDLGIINQLTNVEYLDNSPKAKINKSKAHQVENALLKLAIHLKLGIMQKSIWSLISYMSLDWWLRHLESDLWFNEKASLSSGWFYTTTDIYKFMHGFYILDYKLLRWILSLSAREKVKKTTFQSFSFFSDPNWDSSLWA